MFLAVICAVSIIQVCLRDFTRLCFAVCNRILREVAFQQPLGMGLSWHALLTVWCFLPLVGIAARLRRHIDEAQEALQLDAVGLDRVRRPWFWGIHRIKKSQHSWGWIEFHPICNYYVICVHLSCKGWEGEDSTSFQAVEFNSSTWMSCQAPGTVFWRIHLPLRPLLTTVSRKGTNIDNIHVQQLRPDMPPPSQKNAASALIDTQPPHSTSKA